MKPAQSAIAAIIFDMDGVLVNTEPLHAAVDSLILKEDNIEVDEHDFERWCGMTERECFRQIAEEHGLNAAKVHDWMGRKVSSFDTALQTVGVQPIEGVAELVRYAAATYPCAVGSSSRKSVIAEVVRQIGLSKELSVQIGCDDVAEGRGKPHPDIYLLVAKTLNVDPAHCIVIEDSKNGTKAAKSAGMTVIGYRNPDSGNQDLSQADYLIEHMVDAIDIIKKF